ncbi:hypothetical protein [Halomonas getboli]|uniref:hypothetical protein n=1 Tax=Halomonas getboli TaxID=2935862 RepID=UPI001FFE7A13|nr:hypothetical protein [Halomonas getboli]MCK2183030.1 hypothetical protein [Halomonas getboli]
MSSSSFSCRDGAGCASGIHWAANLLTLANPGSLVALLLGALFFQFIADAHFGWHPGFCGLLVNSVIFVAMSLSAREERERCPAEALTAQT